jgi:hypothetical protein
MQVPLKLLELLRNVTSPIIKKALVTQSITYTLILYGIFVGFSPNDPITKYVRVSRGTITIVDRDSVPSVPGSAAAAPGENSSSPSTAPQQPEPTPTPTPTRTPTPTFTPTPTPTPTPHQAPVGTVQASARWGTNLSAISDWTTGWAFVDAFRGARSWISGNSATWQWDDGRPFDLDENGWVRSLQPNQIARAVVMTLPPNSYPSGTYTVLYEGEGVIAYEGSGRKNSALSRPGRDVLDVDASQTNTSTGFGGLRLDITKTTPSNYIRNIRVILPGGSCAHDATRWCATDSDCGQSACESFETSYTRKRFHPIFLQSVRHFGVIRFMDWGVTNNSSIQRWDQRSKLSDAIWAKRGVPFEVMIELANTLHVHPWINIPHQADDNFIVSLAAMVKSTLNLGLVAHIEYSNEVWNSGFSQYRYAADRGRALGLASVDWEAGWRFYALRSKEVFQYFENVFGGTSRIKRILASQAASSYVSETILKTGDAYVYADALAIAPYFGHEYGGAQASAVATWSPDQLFTSLLNSSIPTSIGWMRAQKGMADKYGVELVAYEGGQHLVGVHGGQDNAQLTALFQAVNRDIRMRALYTTYLDGWAATSPGLFVHFNHVEAFSKWGSWGSAERYPVLDTAFPPKYVAVREATVRHGKRS